MIFTVFTWKGDCQKPERSSTPKTLSYLKVITSNWFNSKFSFGLDHTLSSRQMYRQASAPSSLLQGYKQYHPQTLVRTVSHSVNLICHSEFNNFLSIIWLRVCGIASDVIKVKPCNFHYQALSPEPVPRQLSGSTWIAKVRARGPAKEELGREIMLPAVTDVKRQRALCTMHWPCDIPSHTSRPSSHWVVIFYLSTVDPDTKLSQGLNEPLPTCPPEAWYQSAPGHTPVSWYEYAVFSRPENNTATPLHMQVCVCAVWREKVVGNDNLTLHP